VATAAGHPEAGIEFIKELNIRIQKIKQTRTDFHLTAKRVSFFEWMNPVFNAGHWIPDQITIAGGNDPLAQPNEHSFVIEAQLIIEANPEVIIFSACGMTMVQSIVEVTQVLSQPFWKGLEAYKNNNIWVVEGNLFTQPGCGLIDGIELLAAIFHPNHFSIPHELKNDYLKFDLSKC